MDAKVPWGERDRSSGVNDGRGGDYVETWWQQLVQFDLGGEARRPGKPEGTEPG